MIKISVVIPVYNVGDYLVQCLESVRNQTLKEKEIICIDDGSTDGSWEILQGYADRFAEMRVVRQQNHGAGMARNRGMEIASGEFISFMDADDYYASDAVLECLYDTATEHQALICGGTLLRQYNGKILEYIDSVSVQSFIKSGVNRFQDTQECYYFTKYIYNRHFLTANGICFPPYRQYEDPPFLVKAMAYAQNFYSIPEAVYIYRVSYKSRIHSLEAARDILKGIRDILLMCKANHFDRLKEFMTDELNKGEGRVSFAAIFRRDTEALRLVEEINHIYGEELISPETVTNYVNKSIEGAEAMLEALQRKRRIIIYGAGRIGQRLTAFLEETCGGSLAGYAVSNAAGQAEQIGSYPIRQIEEYLPLGEDEVILVAVAEKQQETILDLLKRYSVQPVIAVKAAQVKYIDMFMGLKNLPDL